MIAPCIRRHATGPRCGGGSWTPAPKRGEARRAPPPGCDATGGRRGAAEGSRCPGGHARWRASASTTTRRGFPRTVEQVRQRWLPMLELPNRSPLILAAAQPHPWMKHCYGAAATASSPTEAGVRPTCPCCLSQARRRPTARRTCGRRGRNRAGTRRMRRLICCPHGLAKNLTCDNYNCKTKQPKISAPFVARCMHMTR